MAKTNETYINAQLLKVQGTPIEDGSIKIKLHGLHGESNWLTLDKIAAKAIEDELYAMAVRKDGAVRP